MQDSEKPKSGRGGKRAGAGRKADEPTVQINPRVKQSVHEWLLELAGEGHVSQAVNIILKHAKETHEGAVTTSLTDRLLMIKAMKGV